MSQSEKSPELDHQQAVSILKQSYEAMQKHCSKELKDEMKLFHLTPEMMLDPTLTASKYLKYLQDNNLKIGDDQMRQVLELAKLEEQYRTEVLRKGVQWKNRSDITSMKKGEDIEWRSRFPDVKMSAETDHVNNIYNKFGNILPQYNKTKEAWLDNYKAKAQVQAADTKHSQFLHLAKHTGEHIGLEIADHTLSHGTNIMQVLAASLGPFSLVFGASRDHAILNERHEKNNNVLMSCNRIDLKIALDYAKQKNAGKNPEFDSSHIKAVNNLAETMEHNGGVKLFTQKVIRDIGTAGAVLGGPGGGLAVLAAMKDMEEREHIPSLQELDSHWIMMNKLTGMGTISLAILWPPSLFLTLPGMAAANASMKVLKNHIEEWQRKTTTKEGASEFLLEIGKIALEIEKSAPKDFQDENLRMRQLTLAEGAVARIARGYKHHSVNDILIATQFAQAADHWFPKKDDEKPIDRYIRESATNLAERIKQTGITDYTNKNQVLKFARQGEKEGLSR